MKSIKFLSLISFLLYTSICFAQSDSPCKITDTLYIPFGFSHILTANSPLIAVMDDLEMDFDSVEVKRIIDPRLGQKIFRVGTNDYIFTFENNGFKDSCTYSIEVLEKDFEEEVPTIEIPNVDVLEDEIFEVEVLVKNIENVIEANFTVGWDNTVMETLRAIPYFGGKLAISSDFTSGALRRETPFSLKDQVISRLTLRADKESGTYVSLIKAPDSFSEYPTIVILDDGLEGKEIDVFVKGGLININERTNCYKGATNVIANVCEDEAYFYNNEFYNSGFYSIPFVTKEGCDSVVLLEVNRLIPRSGKIGTICNTNTNSNFPTSGNYIDTLIRTNGCTTIRTINVNVLPNDSCRAPIEILIADKNITNNESFCVEVSTSNYHEIRNKTLVLNWNEDFVNYRNIDFSEIYEENTPKVSLLEPNGLMIEWRSDNFREGTNFLDNPTLFSLCFQAKKEGQTSIEFIDYLDKDLHSLAEINNIDGAILDARFKNGNITIEKELSCNIPASTSTATICEGENYVLNNQAYNQSGSYQTIFSTTNGCDSIVNLQLEVLPNLATNLTAQICQGENYILNNQAYNQSGSYQTIFSTTNGCDSIVNLQLAVLPTLTTNLNAQICQGENYILNNQAYTQSGNYQASFSTANGCDSIVNLQLEVLPTLTTNLNVQICEGENYILNNQAYNESGNYQAIFFATNGCDSIVNLQLAIVENISLETNAIICEGESYIFDNQNLTQSGSYQQTIISSNGCDSSINLQLTVLSNEESILSETICQGENYILNNQTYNQSGQYQTTFSTVNGCDSIVNLNLAVLDVPAAFPDTVSTGEDESFNFSVLENDILNGVDYEIQLITPPHVGKLVLLADGIFSYEPRFAYSGTTTFTYQLCNEACLPNGCTTTSVTIHIEDNESIIESEMTPTPIPLPNPFETSRIQTIQEGEIFIYNVWGQLVEQRFFRQDSQQQLRNLQQNELPAGIYFYIKTTIEQGKIIESGKLVAISR